MSPRAPSVPIHMCTCMQDNLTELVEVPLAVRERTEGEGLLYAGIHGETDPDSLTDRQNRVDGYKKRLEYRPCVSCDRCMLCIELRGFTRSGEERVTGYLCINGEFETTPYNTCNQGKRSRHDRRKVVYDMTNAPIGWKLGLARKEAKVAKETEQIDERREAGLEGYRGGSKHYKRKGEESGKEGSVQMPRSLTN